jgi:FKBP-type peptidyl-prolyl cis-trans isomerase SlyD
MTSDSITIADDTVVSFHYKLSDADGTINESSEGNSPVVYLHGRNATVPPEQGYGLRNEDAVQRVPLKHLATRGPFQPGQLVVVNTREGGRQARVLKVGHFNVDLDLNHPLAGKTLTFDIEVVGVRAATEEERAHGHAHGPEGHAHDH